MLRYDHNLTTFNAVLLLNWVVLPFRKGKIMPYFLIPQIDFIQFTDLQHARMYSEKKNTQVSGKLLKFQNFPSQFSFVVYFHKKMVYNLVTNNPQQKSSSPKYSMIKVSLLFCETKGNKQNYCNKYHKTSNNYKHNKKREKVFYFSFTIQLKHKKLK